MGHRESLTSEDAMERVRAAKEEKQKKEQEKAERAAARKQNKAEARKRKRNDKQSSRAKKPKLSAQGEEPEWFCPSSLGTSERGLHTVRRLLTVVSCLLYQL